MSATDRSRAFEAMFWFSAIPGGGFGFWQGSVGAGVWMWFSVFIAAACIDDIGQAIRGKE